LGFRPSTNFRKGDHRGSPRAYFSRQAKEGGEKGKKRGGVETLPTSISERSISSPQEPENRSAFTPGDSAEGRDRKQGGKKKLGMGRMGRNCRWAGLAGQQDVLFLIHVSYKCREQHWGEKKVKVSLWGTGERGGKQYLATAYKRRRNSRDRCVAG